MFFPFATDRWSPHGGVSVSSYLWWIHRGILQTLMVENDGWKSFRFCIFFFKVGMNSQSFSELFFLELLAYWLWRWWLNFLGVRIFIPICTRLWGWGGEDHRLNMVELFSALWTRRKESKYAMHGTMDREIHGFGTVLRKPTTCPRLFASGLVDRWIAKERQNRCIVMNRIDRYISWYTYY